MPSLTASKSFIVSLTDMEKRDRLEWHRENEDGLKIFFMRIFYTPARNHELKRLINCGDNNNQQRKEMKMFGIN